MIFSDDVVVFLVFIATIVVMVPFLILFYYSTDVEPIRSRSPNYALVTGIGCLLLTVAEMPSDAQGGNYACLWYLISAYVYLYLIGMPYVIRSYRLAIICQFQSLLLQSRTASGSTSVELIAFPSSPLQVVYTDNQQVPMAKLESVATNNNNSNLKESSATNSKKHNMSYASDEHDWDWFRRRLSRRTALKFALFIGFLHFLGIIISVFTFPGYLKRPSAHYYRSLNYECSTVIANYYGLVIGMFYLISAIVLYYKTRNSKDNFSIGLEIRISLLTWVIGIPAFFLQYAFSNKKSRNSSLLQVVFLVLGGWAHFAVSIIYPFYLTRTKYYYNHLQINNYNIDERFIGQSQKKMPFLLDRLLRCEFFHYKKLHLNSKILEDNVIMTGNALNVRSSDASNENDNGVGVGNKHDYSGTNNENLNNYQSDDIEGNAHNGSFNPYLKKIESKEPEVKSEAAINANHSISQASDQIQIQSSSIESKKIGKKGVNWQLTNVLQNEEAKQLFREFLSLELSIENIMFYDACENYKKLFITTIGSIDHQSTGIIDDEYKSGSNSSTQPQTIFDQALRVYSLFIDPKIASMLVNISFQISKEVATKIQEMKEIIRICYSKNSSLHVQVDENTTNLQSESDYRSLAGTMTKLESLFDNAEKCIIELMLDSYSRFRQTQQWKSFVSKSQ